MNQPGSFVGWSVERMRRQLVRQSFKLIRYRTRLAEERRRAEMWKARAKRG